MRRRAPLAAAAGLLALAGCATPQAGPDGRYARPIGDAPVIDSTTPYTRALDCLRPALAQATTGAPPRIAVGRIADFTGKYDEYSGFKVTQGAALMAVSAFARLGLPQVERLDPSVAEAELKLANNNLIGDAAGAVRLIRAASMPGSDYHLLGGITELNYNIRSVAGDLFVSSGGVGGQLYVLDVALDLRLVRTQTLEIADVVSYRKQIVGRELSAGIFEFFGETLLDVSVGERALEPMQLAVRAMIERAVGEMARRLAGLPPETCAPDPADAGA